MEQLSFPSKGTSDSEVPSFQPPLSLQGSVEKIVYFNDETGQAILDLRSLESAQHYLVSCRLSGVRRGETIRARIEPTHIDHDSSASSPHGDGQLLTATDVHRDLPQSPRLVKAFLKSGVFPDIGPSLAAILAKEFGESLFQVIEQSPDRLLQVSGVGPKRKNQIVENWKDYQYLLEIESAFFQAGLPLIWAKKIWTFQKRNSLTSFLQNPYQAVETYQLEFDKIDEFARSQGFDPLSPLRLKAGINEVLRSFFSQGHCACPETAFFQKCQALLNVSVDEVDPILESECLKGNLVLETIGDTACIYTREIWQTERMVASRLLRLNQQEPAWGWFNAFKVIGWAQDVLQIQLAPRQKEAIEMALNSSLTVITGGPGTGKTTLIRSLVTILKTQFAKFALCSPTGRAAQRLQESTGVSAQTIHRLLKFQSDGRFFYTAQNPLDVDLVLVDEASMVDLSLMSHLLEALPAHCSLILVGDADQIPPVGAGQVLQSVISSSQFKVVRLTDIFRQKEKSLIKLNAARINQGLMPIQDPSARQDFHYIPVSSSAECKRTMEDLVLRVLPEKCGITDPRQFQILVPLNRGPMGAHQLNEELQQLIQIQLEESPEDEETGSGISHRIGDQTSTFQVGDKVMVTVNDYGKSVFNGDIGFVSRIDTGSQALFVQIEDRSVRFSFDELEKLSLAYAISIHKAQGSEYKAVIVLVSPDHLPYLRRHLIYTAVTRGKDEVFLVAEPSTLQAAIESADENRRWEKLTELLRNSQTETLSASRL